jgi:hypothetical protein
VGYNIGIVRNISEKKKMPAIEEAKFFFITEEIQKKKKKIVSMEYIISGITNLYDD